VVLHDWPFPHDQPAHFEEYRSFPEDQPHCYARCVEKHRDDSRWIAFIDVDEFLFSPTLRPLPEILADYEEWPGVGVNWVMFGSSGHKTRPAGLVIENYLQRTGDPDRNRHIKSIVDPSRVASCPSSHYFDYVSGYAVDESKQQLESSSTSKSVSFERLRINHYYMKSAEEAARRFDFESDSPNTRLQPRMWPLRPPQIFERLDRRLNELHDETILAYLPALRRALSARDSKSAGGSTAR
jgi:hypothetical protein